MPVSKYGKYIQTDIKPNIKLPGFRGGEAPNIGQGMLNGHRRVMEHLFWLDKEEFPFPGAFYSEIVWFWPQAREKGHILTPEEAAKSPGVPPHVHPFPEILCYLGTDMNDPHNLNGEIEFWLGDEKFNLTRSFLVYIPANMKHCPLRHLRMDKPLFHFTMGTGSEYK
jgi:hypothetical protein